ncbi:MAG: single-stranded DNA-binding protein [Oscillospiraceae bacterium]|nr:single-stranded DNA-binding protein [Oscillospiraceae bacterium]
MYSRVIVMGRITADLELRQTPSSVSVLSFRIAVNRPFVAKNGERATDFFNVVAWRAQAEFIAKYFKKGSLILVDGRLESREYVDKNGTTQRVVEIIAENVSFTGEAKQSNNDSQGSPRPEEPEMDENIDDFKDLDDDEDLPF